MTTTTVLSLRLPTERAESLKRRARRMDRSASELAARLIDEGLRREDFNMIDFRDSPTGRQAFVQGTRIQVWRAVTLVREYDGDIGKTAEYLNWPESKVKAALNYAEAFPQEIDDAIADDRAYDFEQLKRLIPSLELLHTPAKGPKTN
jgi:uncharacterized protein (DUF433 family)